jgi:hypothetical protein
MEQEKENKKMEPMQNKGSNSKVKIRMKPKRAAEGVSPDENGVAEVSAELAAHLVKIGYAELLN